MKKRIILLSSITVLFLFFVTNAVAQEKAQESKKIVKKEMVKKDVAGKCGGCPTLDKCEGKTALKAKEEKGKTCEGKGEKVATIDKKKKKEKK